MGDFNKANEEIDCLKAEIKKNYDTIHDLELNLDEEHKNLKNLDDDLENKNNDYDKLKEEFLEMKKFAADAVRKIDQTNFENKTLLKEKQELEADLRLNLDTLDK